MRELSELTCLGERSNGRESESLDISIDESSMGRKRSEAGESLSTVASAVTGETTAVEEEGSDDAGCLVDVEEQFLGFFDTGCRGQD